MSSRVKTRQRPPTEEERERYARLAQSTPTAEGDAMNVYALALERNVTDNFIYHRQRVGWPGLNGSAMEPVPPPAGTRWQGVRFLGSEMDRAMKAPEDPDYVLVEGRLWPTTPVVRRV